MNCQHVQESFLDFEAGALPEQEMSAIREHLKSCPVCQREWSSLSETVSQLDKMPVEEASPRLRTNFYAMLDTQIREQQTAHPFAPPRSWLSRVLEAVWPKSPAWQAAGALALLALGLFLGSRTGAPVSHEKTDTAAQLAATQRELAELRAKVDSVDQLVNYSLASREPARARLQHVVSLLDHDPKGEKALADLLNALAFDPSTNVRLSALEALYARAEEKSVRQGVLAALGRESSPLVQVAMIDFLASVKEPDAAPVFQELARTPTGDPSVRSAAQRALALL